MAFRQRSDPARLLWRRALLCLIFVLVLAALWGVYGAYREDRESAALKEQSALQLSDLQTREAQLNSDIATMKTDRGMEGMLREQYALAAKGEEEIVIVDGTGAPPVPNATSSAFAQWVHKFFPWW